MALPIKDTPVLTGKDAERFDRMLKEQKKVPREEIERAKRNVARFKVNGELL